MATAHLPSTVCELLDGRSLEEKVGLTLVLTTVDGDGWPRQALLSVGEVLVADEGSFLVALHAGSRTAAALRTSGRGLLTVVVEGTVHRIWFEVAPVGAASGPLHRFLATVAAVDGDTVGYAEVLHGIEYRLEEPERTLERWRRQLDDLRALGGAS